MKDMIYPKMILFDYGQTLLNEPGWDSLRGNEALLPYIKNNSYTSQQINDTSQKLFDEISAARKLGFEMHERQFQRVLFESLGIELTVSYEEVEKIFWDHTSAGAVMPGAEEMLDFINAAGIRSGVISNISFSGSALTQRINRLLPRNRFEFIITSSEYMFRKPSRYLFELALKKAGLDASEVWFCGDNVKADVEGSAAAGLFPVWYENLTVENPWREEAGTKPHFLHLHIHEWRELIGVLEEIK